MTNEHSELGEGFYWMAEKLTWGYEHVTPNHSEALRLFKQAADLGVSDAWIRLGELNELGKGKTRDLREALKCYGSAARAGNYYALAYAAQMLCRGPALDKAEQLWEQFFRALAAKPEPGFKSASRGELLFAYIRSQLRVGLQPLHLDILERYRLEIVAHYQQLLEHARLSQFDNLEAVSNWIEVNLGPWPTDPRND
jgi:TPR repeat protein